MSGRSSSAAAAVQIGVSSGAMELVIAPPAEIVTASPNAGRVVVVTGGLYVDPAPRPRIDLFSAVPEMTFEEIEGGVE